MDEKVRQQLVDDHFLFMSGDPNLKVAGMERDWPEGKSIRVSRWLEPNFQILCIWPFGLAGLRLRYYTLQNLIPSFSWITLGRRAATWVAIQLDFLDRPKMGDSPKLGDLAQS